MLAWKGWGEFENYVIGKDSKYFQNSFIKLFSKNLARKLQNKTYHILNGFTPPLLFLGTSFAFYPLAVFVLRKHTAEAKDILQ